MDELTREILTRIQGGQFAFQPTGATIDAIQDFQATAKRIEWAKREGYIKDAKPMLGSPDGEHTLTLHVAIVGGLTLEGEHYLLGDLDDRAF